jgi:hypothetical protein
MPNSLHLQPERSALRRRGRPVRRCVARALALVVASGISISASAQTASGADANFGGLLIGVEIARQNVIAGALIGGVDVLAQESKLVTSIVTGYRHQWGEGWVAGVEAGLGRIDGDLTRNDPNLTIRYEHRPQLHFGATAGRVVDLAGPTLVFTYVSEVKREFEVTGTRNGQRIGQSDEQGLLRYGVGVERNVWRGLNVRVTPGSSRADFGGRPTNIDVKRPIDFSLALIYQDGRR